MALFKAICNNCKKLEPVKAMKAMKKDGYTIVWTLCAACDTPERRREVEGR